jgi:hypothetical protein
MAKCTYCKEEHKLENTGCNNSGNRNSGDYNSGDYNSGNRNSGSYNSGHRNSGNRNSGNFNSGNFNSGNRNSGDYNSGYFNSGDYNSGWFNTNEPKMRFFNKDSNLTYSEFAKQPRIYPDLKICAWVDNKDLPKDEQTTATEQMGGKLKTLDYKEAWAEYWGRASDDDKKWFQSLPNFDAKIFESITGINVGETSLKGKEVEVNVDGKVYKAIIQ